MREVLHRYLLERPAGATVPELLDLVFTQPGRDREFGARFVHTLLEGDPRFAFRDTEQRWIATAHAALARPLADSDFVVVDLETTGGSPDGGHAIIEIGAVRIERGRVAHVYRPLAASHAREPLPAGTDWRVLCALHGPGNRGDLRRARRWLASPAAQRS